MAHGNTCLILWPRHAAQDDVSCPLCPQALKYGDLIAYLQDAFSVHIPSRATQQEEGAAPAAEPENSDEQLQVSIGLHGAAWT